MIQMHLAPAGVALLATKRFYFGVGGGTADTAALVATDSNLSMEVAVSYNDGVSNIRDIIVVRKCNNK